MMIFCAGQAVAGTYSQNFDTFSVGSTNFGDGSQLFSSEPGIVGVQDSSLKELQLSQHDTTNITRAAFLLPDLDPGAPVRSFSASWVSPMYGNFPSASLGFSFSLGSLRSNDLANALYAQERGFDSGLSFCVQTFLTSTTPGWYVRHNGSILATVTNDPVATWGNFSGARHAFQVNWNRVNGLSVIQDGVMIFTNVPTPGFVPKAGDSFVWATRCGANMAETFRVDNISVTTTPGLPPLIQSASVAPIPLQPQIEISADIDTRGEDTTLLFQAGTNLSYSVSTTNFLSGAAGSTHVTMAVPLDTDRSMPIYTRFVASNIYGGTITNVVTQSVSFEKQINNLFPVASAIAWGDFNDDGFIDFAASGMSGDANCSGFIFPNPGKPTNAWSSIATWNSPRSCMPTGDFDNDNRPDMFCIGDEYNYIYGTAPGISATLIYGVPTNLIGQLGRSQQSLFFPFFVRGARAMVQDLDHDGRQDVLFTGYMIPTTNGPVNFTNAPYANVGEGSVSRVMRNEFAGARGSNQDSYFRLMASSLPWIDPLQIGKTDAGFFSEGDLDGDGFVDVYGAGFHRLNSEIEDWKLFRGDGEMGFGLIDAGSREFSRLDSASSSLWADFNGDGHEDLLISEGSYDFGSSKFTLILLNDGQGHLTNSGWTLPQVTFAGIDAGDIFNHGRNDIVMAGRFNAENGGFYFFKVLRNDGNGVFTPMDFGFPDNGLTSNQGKGIELVDYDQDGRLDISHVLGGISLSGWSVLTNSTAIYRNELDIPSNTPPQAPVNLSTVVGPGTVTFNWGSATDDITPTNLLTYNLRVGTNSLGTSVVSPLANVTNGWRKVTGPGNCRHIFSTTYHLPPGTYYWSVQAIDGAYAGGAWAAEQTFTITDPERPTIAISRNNSESTLSWPVRFSDYALQQSTSLTASDWVATTNVPLAIDGKFTVSLTNQPTTRFFRLRK
jgi:hypothetical protein